MSAVSRPLPPPKDEEQRYLKLEQMEIKTYFKVTLPNIVCTSCHRDDSAMVKDLVRKFGQFTFSSR